MVVQRRTEKESIDTKSIADSIKSTVEENAEKINRVEFLDSGSTVLNMILSGRGKDGGWARGRIVNIVGDGSTGKTLLALEMAARACFRLKPSQIYPKVKKINIVYNNVEGVMDFPLEKMFKPKGKEFEERVEWIRTPTIESFEKDYCNRIMKLKEGEFLLYIVDSFDALDSEAATKRFMDAITKDKAEDGSYGMEKQKESSKLFRHLCDFTEGKDATLIIISQVRTNIGITFGKKFMRAGGKALDFYTHQVVWLAVKEHLNKTYLGETKTYGIRVKAKLDRSKVSKPFREGEFIILFNHGVDSINSNLAYVYGPDKKKLEWDGEEYDREVLAKKIEKENLEDELAKITEDKWNKVEDYIEKETSRKNKF